MAFIVVILYSCYTILMANVDEKCSDLKKTFCTILSHDFFAKGRQLITTCKLNDDYIRIQE